MDDKHQWKDREKEWDSCRKRKNKNKNGMRKEIRKYGVVGSLLNISTG